MDYTDDACMYMFSLDQINRMHACINTSRSGLLTSTGCQTAGPPPVASFTATTHNICAGQPVTFIDATTGGTPTVYSWNFGSGAVPATSTTVGPHTVQFNTSGTIVVSQTASNSNGSSTHLDTIYVQATPNPVITGNAIVCASSTLTYSVTSVANSTYVWSATGGTIASGQGTNAATINWTAAGTGTVIITQTNPNSCGRSDTLTVTKQTTIVPVITGSTSSCGGLQKVYSIPVIAGATYLWTVTNGTIASGQGTASVTITWGASGTGVLSVAQTLYAGCVANNSVSVTINQAPTPTINGTANVCEGGTLTFNVGAIAGSTYNWLLNCSGCAITNGQGTSNIAVQFSTPGSSSIQLQQSLNGCIGNSQVYFVTIHAKPTPTFNVALNGLNVAFTNTTSSGVSYLWNFGDSQTDASISPNHTYSSPGTYVVVLTVTDAFNCVNSIQQSVVVTEGNIGINALHGSDNYLAFTPNPAQDQIAIQLTTAETKSIKISLTDVLGRKIKDLYIGKSKTPNSIMNVSISDVPNGVYFIKVEGLSTPLVKKMLKN